MMSDKTPGDVFNDLQSIANFVGRQCKRIEQLEARIAELGGDLEVMRLQRDATHVSRCPNCERLTAVYEAAKDAVEQSPPFVTLWLQDAVAAVEGKDDAD